MSRRLQWVLTAAFVAAAVLAALVAGRRLDVELPPGAVGSPAPDFTAYAIDGSGATRSLSDYAGSVVLLNVWATWCPPCIEEMPSIQKLHEALGPDGLRVVAVSIDDASAEAGIHAFIERLGLTFEVLHDPAGEITHAYRMFGVPESFLIDHHGRIRLKRHATDWFSDENRAAVEAVLAERPGSGPDDPTP